ncbi:unnamed protein product [Effrenium voratum]|nr:unnamed protein product [Effrenium voratum]
MERSARRVRRVRASRPMLLAIWASLAAVALGDGEFLFSTTTTAAQTPVVSADCNPFRGTRYITIGNGNGIKSSQCTASWDLYEIRVFDENDNQLSVTATSNTGYDDPYTPFKAVDGSTATFWAGDHDVGMSCSCWDDGKKDGQAIRLDLGSEKTVSRIQLVQGGADDEWAVSKIRVHCHSSSLNANPLELGISMGTTDITCGINGCSASVLNPGYTDTCDGITAAAGAASFGLAMLVGLGLAGQ